MEVCLQSYKASCLPRKRVAWSARSVGQSCSRNISGQPTRARFALSASLEFLQKMKIDLIVPVYRNLELVIQCLSSLRAHLPEIASHEPRLIVIDDSPDDKEVTAYLKRAQKEQIIDVLLVNEINLGFVKSVNKGLELAQARNAAVILINSDTVTFENTLRELVQVALLDEQFGFVCPRSNNASICTFPWLPHNRAGATITPEECHRTWDEVRERLPRYSFVPTAIGFYMFINSDVVANFGCLDERFGAGYEEENDLVMRAGKVGFRAVLANHSFAYHAGAASFLLSNIDLDKHREANLRTMSETHPEFLPLVHKYESSPLFRSERMLSTLVSDASGKLDIAFNLLGLTPIHNGTNEFVVSVIKAVDQLGSKLFNLFALCSREAAQFHGIDKLQSVRVRNSATGTYAVALSFGQPYDLHDVNVMEGLSPINVYSMLDTISVDCSNLRVEQNVEQLWAHVASTANGLIFISSFSRDTFLRRFDAGHASLFSRLLPTKLSAYEGRYQDVAQTSHHVFIAGNHYPHKNSSSTARYLANRFPSLQFVTMAQSGTFPPNVECLTSGGIDYERMAETLAASSVVVLPSFYEGFGFSLLHALALRKPVVARDIPATREIMAQFGSTSGVFLYSNERELEAALRSAIKAKKSTVHDESGEDWATWSTALLKFLEELVATKRVYGMLVKRISNGDMLRVTRSISGANKSTEQAPIRLDMRELTAGDPDEFIRSAYVRVLGREPDHAGLVHHREMLQSGLSRKDMVRAMLRSIEYQSSGRDVQVRDLQERRRSLFFRIFK